MHHHDALRTGAHPHCREVCGGPLPSLCAWLQSNNCDRRLVRFAHAASPTTIDDDDDCGGAGHGADDAESEVTFADASPTPKVRRRRSGPSFSAGGAGPSLSEIPIEPMSPSGVGGRGEGGGFNMDFNHRGMGGGGGPRQNRRSSESPSSSSRRRRKAKGQNRRGEEAETAFFRSLITNDRSVRRLPSGVAFRILKKGTGTRSPVACERTGAIGGITLWYSAAVAVGPQKGKVFDTSAAVVAESARLSSSSFSSSSSSVNVNVNGGSSVPPFDPTHGGVRGLSEALQLMREGDKWEVFVPFALAFGDEGWAGRGAAAVPPRTTVVYTVELREVAAVGSSWKDAEDTEAAFLRYFGLEYSSM